MFAHLSMRQFIILAALSIFMMIELLFLAIASAFALGGLFELGTTITYACSILFSLGALYLLFIFLRNALSVEQKISLEQNIKA